MNDSNINISSSNSSSAGYPTGYEAGIEDLATNEKEEFLTQICPEIKKFDIAYTLKRNNGNFRKTLDEFLNQIWVQENSKIASLPKSVDGFFNEEDDGGAGPVGTRRKGKKRAKKKLLQQQSSSESQQSSSSSSLSPDLEPSAGTGTSTPNGNAAPNIWATKASDLTYLTTRLPNIDPATLSPLYHQCNTSIRSTLMCLCKVDSKRWTSLDPENTDIQISAATLLSTHTALETRDALTLTLLTHPFSNYANDLAIALLKTPTSSPTTGTFDHDSKPATLQPQYKRPDLSSTLQFSPIQTHISIDPNADPNTLLSSASTALSLRETRYAQASRAYRLSRSQPLMGGAAAYYSAASRSASNRARELTSLAADALIASQAPPKGREWESVDLHGLSAADAVRVTMPLVANWWRGKEEGWERDGGVGRKGGMGHEGFRIITGRGGHSEGGRAKVRPAVVGALKKGGWRVWEGEVGWVVVSGRVRG